jgi:hypothetical protein
MFVIDMEWPFSSCLRTFMEWRWNATGMSLAILEHTSGVFFSMDVPHFGRSNPLYFLG